MELEPVSKLTKDIKAAARTLTQSEARYYVDTYYKIQDARIRARNQERAADQSVEAEPNNLDAYLGDQFTVLEKEIAKALAVYVDAQPIGIWAKANKGVGPVIAAGIISRIDIHKAEHPSSIWRYAGLAPGQKRKKGQLVDWNPDLKRICWLLGESFVKVSGYNDAVYAKLYLSHKAKEQAQNENGHYTALAAEILATKNFDKTSDAYKAYSSGKLPPAHLHARAKRYAVKRFLSDLYAQWRAMEGLPVSVPWALSEYGGH